MSDCLFCKIVDKQLPANIAYEDNKVLVFHDITPKARVHLLLIPKIHIESLDEVTPEHDALMAHILRLLPKIAKEHNLDSGFRTIINTGHGGGQVVFHLHMHLLGGSNLPGFG